MRSPDMFNDTISPKVKETAFARAKAAAKKSFEWKGEVDTTNLSEDQCTFSIHKETDEFIIVDVEIPTTSEKIGMRTVGVKISKTDL